MQSGAQAVSTCEVTNNHLYYSGILSNLNQSGAVQASFIESRANNLIDQTQDWIGAMTKFHVPSTAVPLFAFQTNSYVVDLQYLGHSYTATVNYISDSIPNYGNENYVWNVGQMLDAVNNAYVVCAASLTAAYPSLNSTITVAPYITYNPANYLFTAWAPTVPFASDLATGSGTYGVTMGMNYLTYSQFFDTFRASGPINDFVQFIMTTNHGLNYNTSFPGWIAVQPQAQCVSDWLDIVQLIFTSNLIPARFQSLPPPQNLTNVVSDVQLPILLSFNINPTATEALENTGYNYFAPGEWKWFDLNGGTLRTLDMQVFWRGKDGSLHPIYLRPGEIFTFELLFESIRQPHRNPADTDPVNVNGGGRKKMIGFSRS